MFFQHLQFWPQAAVCETYKNGGPSGRRQACLIKDIRWCEIRSTVNSFRQVPYEKTSFCEIHFTVDSFKPSKYSEGLLLGKILTRTNCYRGRDVDFPRDNRVFNAYNQDWWRCFISNRRYTPEFWDSGGSPSPGSGEIQCAIDVQKI